MRGAIPRVDLLICSTLLRAFTVFCLSAFYNGMKKYPGPCQIPAHAFGFVTPLNHRASTSIIYRLPSLGCYVNRKWTEITMLLCIQHLRH